MTHTAKNPNDVLRWSFFIILFAILIYGFSLRDGFVWDDNYYILKNPSIHSWSGLFKMWSSPDIAFYDNPITLSFLWLEHKLWGFHPLGYHMVNLVLHILNALLLFGILRKLSPHLAGITALLFTIHPIQVETVAWASEQKNLLCLFFFLLAFHSFLDFDRQGKRKDYLKMILFFIAALLSKNIAICFSAVPFLYAWWKKGKISRTDLIQTLPLFILGGSIAFMSVATHNVYSTAEEMLRFSQKIILSGKLFFFYLKQTFLPWQFLTFYPKWDLSWKLPQNWIFFIGVFALYGILYRMRHRVGRGAFALLGFYGISIFPALGFFYITLMKHSYASDHFTYLSLPPILLLGTSAISALDQKIKQFASEKKATFSFFSFSKKIILTIVILYLSVLSFRLTLKYKNSYVLFRQLVLQSPQSAPAHYHLARLCLDHLDSCDLLQAGWLLQKAIQLGQKDFDVYEGLGFVYEKKLFFAQAIKTYQQAIDLEKRSILLAYLYKRMGVICLFLNSPRKALFYFEKALSYMKDPLYHKQLYLYSAKGIFKSADEYTDLGNAYFQNGKYPEAVKAFRRAITLAPTRVENYLALGNVFVRMGQRQEALEVFRQAEKLAPGNKDVLDNLQAVDFRP